MNKKLFSLLAGMTMVFAGLTLASCGGDDDNNGNEGGLQPVGKATEAYATPVVIVSDNMLDIYDATCTINGQSVTLTRDNTVLFDTTSNGYAYSVRKYVGATKTYNQFPAQLNIVEHLKLKDGVDVKTASKFDMVINAKFVYTNNNVNHEITYGASSKAGVFSKNSDPSKWSDDNKKKFSDITLQLNDTLKTADNLGAGYKLTYGK